MVNSVGTCEGKAAGGGTLALGRAGQVLSQLDGSSEGALTYDTRSGSTVAVPVGA